MSASSIITLSPAAFHSLLAAVRSAVKPHRHPFRPCPPPCCKSQPCDRGGCRILLNEARREIDRLRRQIDRLDLCSPLQPSRGGNKDSESMACKLSADLASPFQRRRTYAVAAVGDIRNVQQPLATTRESPHANRVPNVTNLGTCLDVLV